MLTGNNGILTQANNAKIEQSHGAVREAIAILYNEYQIQINTASNTKLASTEVVTIKGQEEKALANTSMTFLDFLKGGNSQGINYIKEGTDDVLDVGKLTGSGQSLGNGTDTDIYKVEEENSSYIVNYYDINGTPKQIWSIASADNEDDSSKYSVENINYGMIGLKDLQNDSFTTFTSAYINYNNEIIDITDCIYNQNNMSIIEGNDIRKVMRETASGFSAGLYEVRIVKDGKSYSGEVEVSWDV